MPETTLLAMQLESEAAAAGRARQAVGALVSHALRSVEGPDLLLLTTELVTNAVRHGAGDPITLHVSRADKEMRLRVSNPGTLSTPAPTVGGPHGGWGLQLVAAVSSEWGREVADGWTHVWFAMREPRETLLQRTRGPQHTSA